MDDYTLDRRGDVGAWVREASMKALRDLTFIVSHPEKYESFVKKGVSSIVKQSVEKIDRTRGLAVKILWEFVTKTNPEIVGIPEKKKIQEIFPSDLDESSFQWSVESITFPLLIKLIRVQHYRIQLLEGLVVSVGGLTERLVKHSSGALYNELKAYDYEELKLFGESLIEVYDRNKKLDRVIIPTFKFTDQLINSGYLDDIFEEEENEEGYKFTVELVNRVKAEVSKCGDPNKLMLGTDVFCGLLQSGDANAVKKGLVQLSILLCHKFPRIRKATANKLFEALLTYSDKEIVPEENKAEIDKILADTNWDESVENLRPVRNNLCELMKVPAPAIIKKAVQ